MDNLVRPSGDATFVGSWAGGIDDLSQALQVAMHTMKNCASDLRHCANREPTSRLNSSMCVQPVGATCVARVCYDRRTVVTSDLRSDGQLELCFSVRTALRFEHAGFVLDKAQAVRQRAVDIAVKIAAMVASLKACLLFYLKCQRRVLRLLVLASVKRRSLASQLSNKQTKSI